MIEDFILRLDQYLHDSWLDGVMAAILAGGATAGLKLAVGLLAS